LLLLQLYKRDGDDAWLAKMYPLLEGYLKHWLTKRVDAGGYQICMCTWESGQDMMCASLQNNCSVQILLSDDYCAVGICISANAELL
jgi:hypothetical protein